MPAQSTVSVDLDAPNTYARAMSAIQVLGGQVKTQSPPQNAQFSYVLKNIWTTGGMSIKFDGSVNVQPVSNKQSRLTANVKVDSSSATPYYLTLAGLGLFSLVFGVGGLLFLLCFLVSAIYSYTQFNTKTPEELCKKIVDALPVANTTYTPPPMDAGPIPTPDQGPAAANEGTLDIPGQIKKLAELRDIGALTAVEFDAKKAELLKRL